MKTVNCEYCGKTLPKNEATFCEDGDFYACPDCANKHFVVCERCGITLDRDDAYLSVRGDGYLCECCHDDLFG